MKKSKMKRAVIYARSNSSSQNDLDTERQLQNSREYCKKSGYTVVNEYVDIGFSGTNYKRPSFNRMINDSYDNTFDIVVVFKMNRFSRTFSSICKYISELDSNNVTLISIIKNFNNSPTVEITQEILDKFS